MRCLLEEPHDFLELVFGTWLQLIWQIGIYFMQRYVVSLVHAIWTAGTAVFDRGGGENICCRLLEPCRIQYIILHITGYGWWGWNVCLLEPPARDSCLRCVYCLLQMVFLIAFVSIQVGTRFVDIT